MSKSRKNQSKNNPDKPNPEGQSGLLGPLAELPPQPKFIVTNEAGVKIDIDGKDTGPAERHGKGQVLDKSSGKERVGDLMVDQIEVERKLQRIFRVQDSLDIMVRNGTITDKQFSAGKRFKLYHDLSNKSHVTTVNFDKVGGQMSKEDFVMAQVNASRKVSEILDHLGGESSVAARALVNIICRGYSFDYMADFTGIGKHYWRGAVQSALDGLVGYFNKPKSNHRVTK